VAHKTRSGRTRSSVPLNCSPWSSAEKWREIKSKNKETCRNKQHGRQNTSNITSNCFFFCSDIIIPLKSTTSVMTHRFKVPCLIQSVPSDTSVTTDTTTSTFHAYNSSIISTFNACCNTRNTTSNWYVY